MTEFRVNVSLCCLVMLGLSATLVRSQEKKPAGKEIDDATVAAYEKLARNMSGG